MSEWVLDLKGVRKTYSGGVQALRGVDLQVPRGTIFGLLGPNGAGKSTLVKILTTVIRPTACEGLFLGKPVGDKKVLARVGYLPEHARFPEYLTANEVVKMAAGLCGLKSDVTKKRSQELLARVGLADWQHKKVGGFSKGMKQRVGLAQALINEPEVIFLDEPTDGVDPAGRRDIRLLLEDLRAEGKTVFVNSHLLGELEMVCDRVAILSKGEIKLEGELSKLTGQSVDYRLTCRELPRELRQSLEGKGARWKGGELIIPATRPEDAMPYLDELRQAGIVVESFSRTSMSLEDLFMKTVGTDTPGAAPRTSSINNQPPPLS